jgi:hypothetical protein
VAGQFMPLPSLACCKNCAQLIESALLPFDRFVFFYELFKALSY